MTSPALRTTLLGAMAALCATYSISGSLAGTKARTCKHHTQIDEVHRVRSNGAQLYTLVRGNHCTSPILLWLHGGPGGAEAPLFRIFDSALEEQFLVVYWDQRGAGRSYDPKADPSSLTVAQHVADLDRVIETLRSEFGGRKVALVGHSWGSALGLLYANEHPEKVSAVVGVNQYVSGLKAQLGQYRFVSTQAKRTGDEAVQRRLARIGTPPLDAELELELQSLVDHFGGLFHTRPSFFLTIVEGLLQSYVLPWEIGQFIHANEVSLRAMNAELLGLDLQARVRTVEMPVYFFLGRFDRQLDARDAIAYFGTLAAPAKEIIWFEKSAHNIPFEEPDTFVACIRAVLAPQPSSEQCPLARVR